MDFGRKLQRILRIFWAYACVGIILLIFLCVGSWSILQTWFQAANDAFRNMFQRRRYVTVMESEDEMSKEHQTSPKSTNPSRDITSKHAPSLTFSDPTKRVNTKAEKDTNKQTKDYQISKKERFQNLEGLALQMAQLEQHRMSRVLPRRDPPRVSFIKSPNKPLPVHVPTPKSVLKSPSSENKPTSIRNTRRIRFQEPPFSESTEALNSSIPCSKKAASGSSLGPKMRRVSPPSYLIAGLNLHESPAKTYIPVLNITEPLSEELEIENTPMTNLSSEMLSNQQHANEKIDSSTGESHSTISSVFSETADTRQIMNESIASLSEESGSTIPPELSSEVATSQQLTDHSMDSFPEVLNPSNPTMVSTENVSNLQVANITTDSLLEDLNYTNPTALSSETACSQQVSKKSSDSLMEESSSTIRNVSSETPTNQQLSDKSMDSLSNNLNPTNPTEMLSAKTNIQKVTSKTISSLSVGIDFAFPKVNKELEESPEVEDVCFEQENVELTSASKGNKGERSLQEQTLEVTSTKIKEKDDELRKASPALEKTESSFEKESLKKDTDNISEFLGESENKGESLETMTVRSDPTIQQSTKESVNANRSESSSDELNTTMLKTDEEICTSLESNDQFQVESMKPDHKESSQEIITKSMDETDDEKLKNNSSEKRDVIKTTDEAASFTKEENKHVTESLKSEDALQPGGAN